MVLSGFIVLLLSGGIVADNSGYSHTNANNTPHFSLVATDLFSLTASAERFFENGQRILSEPARVSFGDYLSVVHLTETTRNHLLTKNIAYARYMVPRFDLQDIVFPFHHFW